MDIDNGEGDILRGLPCLFKLSQLSCNGGGSNYPEKAINSFIEDNRALMRRMFGEMQEPKTFTTMTLRVVRTYVGPTR